MQVVSRRILDNIDLSSVEDSQIEHIHFVETILRGVSCSNTQTQQLALWTELCELYTEMGFAKGVDSVRSFLQDVAGYVAASTDPTKDATQKNVLLSSFSVSVFKLGTELTRTQITDQSSVNQASFQCFELVHRIAAINQEYSGLHRVVSPEMHRDACLLALFTLLESDEFNFELGLELCGSCMNLIRQSGQDTCQLRVLVLLVSTIL